MNETIQDQESQKAIEKANAYREMMNLWAWKDLMGVIHGIKTDAESEIHRLPVEKLSHSGFIVARMQGIRTAFDKMEAEINYITGMAERTK